MLCYPDWLTVQGVACTADGGPLPWSLRLWASAPACLSGMKLGDSLVCAPKQQQSVPRCVPACALLSSSTVTPSAELCSVNHDRVDRCNWAFCYSLLPDSHV